MTAALRRVRVDRLVLDGVHLDAHDLALLPRLVAAALADHDEPARVGPPEVGDVHTVAAEIAHRTRAAVREQAGRP